MKVISQARLADYTTFQLGGPCERLFDCVTTDDLREAFRACAGSFTLIGGGSNLLVSDAGPGGSIIRYASAQPQIQVSGEVLDVSGATALDDLAAFAVDHGLDGVTCCTGIPGTVGGAVCGNAGAFGEQIADHLETVELMKPDGTTWTAQRDQLGFAYRKSSIPETGDLVVSIRLALTAGDRIRLRERREEIIALRAAKHPDWRKIPTAGSFFKNIEPTSLAGRRQAAGWFLEQAGALQLRVGGAHTFEKHANIIVADPGCTAADVLELSRQMSARVHEKFQLNLEREVKVLGRFPA